jgi:hypothetical protein
VEREDRAAAVAGDADEQHRGQPVAHHGRAQCRGQDQQPDHHLQRRVPQREVGPVTGAEGEDDHGNQHERGKNHRLGGRDRTALGERGEPHRHEVEISQRGVVNAVGVAERLADGAPPAQPCAAEVGRRADGKDQCRQQQWRAEPMPQREVVVLAARHRVGVRVENVIQAGRPQAEDQTRGGQDGRRREEGGRRLVHLRDPLARLR